MQLTEKELLMVSAHSGITHVFLKKMVANNNLNGLHGLGLSFYKAINV